MVHRETQMGNHRYLAFAALAAGTLLGMSPLLGASSALAAACATASVGVYEAAGFSCNVGPVTFSDISVLSTTNGSGVVVLTDFSPFTTVVDGVTEYGLDLSFASDTGTTPGSLADVALTFDVSGTPWVAPVPKGVLFGHRRFNCSRTVVTREVRTAEGLQ